MGATGTVALRIDGLEVPAGDVVGVQTDAGLAETRPARIGVASARAARDRRASDPPAGSEHVESGCERDGARARGGATSGGRCRPTRSRSRCKGAIAAGASEGVERAVAAGAAERDRGLALARRATDALVAASGGGAMSLDHPAQRLSREATFYMIQAQTGELRAASLARAIDVS